MKKAPVVEAFNYLLSGAITLTMICDPLGVGVQARNDQP